jgi:hypothetical protein
MLVEIQNNENRIKSPGSDSRLQSTAESKSYLRTLAIKMPPNQSSDSIALKRVACSIRELKRQERERPKRKVH